MGLGLRTRLASSIGVGRVVSEPPFPRRWLSPSPSCVRLSYCSLRQPLLFLSLDFLLCQCCWPRKPEIGVLSHRSPANQSGLLYVSFVS
ncbi:hypothetical protein VTK73DRAFT_6752 [Phialemonium thermophilum]|uniref:Uncharacterized protein n=1 Tax=Phialemonium thermophilum TaxID=223376 RepID=A0ABR3WHS6_9PEZI